MEIVENILQSLSIGQGSHPARLVPTLLIDAHCNPGFAEHTALEYFKKYGFEAERCYTNSAKGYVGLLHKLSDPPVWQNNVKQREFSLALIEQIRDTPEEKLLKTYKEYNEEIGSVLPIPEDTKRQFNQQALQEFQSLISLGICFNSHSFEKVYRALFEYDEFRVNPPAGAPDLLVWYRQGNSGFWFFTEVKGPRDYLSDIQWAWLYENWEDIRGHYLITLIGEAA